jgi:hypothetical protein
MWVTKPIAVTVLVMLIVGIGVVLVALSAVGPEATSMRSLDVGKSTHQDNAPSLVAGLSVSPAVNRSIYDASGCLVLTYAVRTSTFVTPASSSSVDSTSIAKLD